MKKKIKYVFTKDFQVFVKGLDLTWQETCDLYDAARYNRDTALFKVNPAISSQDTIIFCPSMELALRMTPKAKEKFPEWIQKNLMEGLDSETYWDVKNEEEKED